MKAPFAPPGGRLAGETLIRSSEVYGHRSEGVLCSPAELGMSRWHEGLLELSEEIAPARRWPS